MKIFRFIRTNNRNVGSAIKGRGTEIDKGIFFFLLHKVFKGDVYTCNI